MGIENGATGGSGDSPREVSQSDQQLRTVIEPSQNDTDDSVLRVLWRDRHATAQLLSGRFVEFIGKGFLASALSTTSYAAEATLSEQIFTLFVVPFGGIIVGTSIDLSLARAKLIEHLRDPRIPRPNITIKLISGTIIVASLTLISFPLIYYSDVILHPIIHEPVTSPINASLTLANTTLPSLLDVASDNILTNYKMGVVATFYFNWLIDSIMNSFHFDKTFLASKIASFVVIMFMSQLYVTAEDDDERYSQYALTFLLSSLLPTLLALSVILTSTEDKSMTASEPQPSLIKYVAVNDLFVDGALHELSKSLRMQCKSGIVKFFSLWPTIALEFAYIPLALLISKEASGAMRGLIIPHLVLLLMGVSSQTILNRKAATIRGSIHHDTSQECLQNYVRTLHLNKRAYFLLNLGLGLLAVGLSAAYTPLIQSQFAPENVYLGDRLTHMLFMLATACWIINDGEEGVLDGLKIIRVKAISTPIATLSCIPLGYVMVTHGGGLRGMFGTTAAVMFAYSLFLIVYTNKQIPKTLQAKLERVTSMDDDHDSTADSLVSRPTPTDMTELRIFGYKDGGDIPSDTEFLYEDGELMTVVSRV